MNGVFIRQKVNNFKSVLNDANRHHFLTVVTAVHHKSVDETLNDGTLRLAETSYCPSSGTMRDILLVLVLLFDSDVVFKGDVLDYNVVERPSANEQTHSTAAPLTIG